MAHLILPKILFSDDKYQFLSTEAKVLYSFLADRTSLSKKTGDRWFDGKDYFVIFSQSEVMARFHCGHDKATKIIRELESVGLIKRKRSGIGKTFRIYVDTYIYGAEKKQE